MKKHALFIALLLGALFLRLYKLPHLTTFGRDQGIDFDSVKKMIDTRQPTLLGIKVSIADFHQGPIYLYMLVPLFLVMGSHPMAGAYTAVIVAGVTLVVLYVVMRKFFGQSVALLSSAIFAISPEFIREGTTPLYQHFLPLFLVLALGILLQFLETKKTTYRIVLMTALGVVMGLCLELHFLAITSCVAIPLFFVIWYRKLITYMPLYGLGLIVGVSPTIAFEVRHQFLNTHLFWTYITNSSSNGSMRTIMSLVDPWIDGMAKWYGADNRGLGITLLLIVLGCLSLTKLKGQQQILKRLLIVTGVVTVIFQLSLRSFEAHYGLPVWVLLLGVFSVWLTKVKLSQRLVINVGVALLMALNMVPTLQAYTANHGYSMPAGWTLQKIMHVSEIIRLDANDRGKVNVASLLDGDTRSYPLRYTLQWQGLALESPEKYPESSFLYVVTTRDKSELENSAEWEISSFQPFSSTQEWDLDDDVKLYRLEKSKTNSLVIID